LREDEADLLLAHPPLSLDNPITVANKQRDEININGNVYILK